MPKKSPIILGKFHSVPWPYSWAACIGEDRAYAARFTQCNPLCGHFGKKDRFILGVKKAAYLSADGSRHSLYITDATADTKPINMFAITKAVTPIRKYSIGATSYAVSTNSSARLTNPSRLADRILSNEVVFPRRVESCWA